MQKNKQHRLLLAGKVLVILALFGLFYWLNCRTLLLWDDFDYSFVATGAGTYGERLQSVGDVLRSQATFRETWGGRNVVHAIAQFFLMLGDKRIFDVCNSLVYLVLLWSIWACSGFQKGRGFVALPLAFYLMWYLPRHFNQSALWLVGSCNYLWGITFVTVALVPFSRYWHRGEGFRALSHWWALVPYWLFCFFAGWTNENTGFALPMMMVFFLVANRITGRRSPRWMPVSALASLAGWVVMFMAPGNWNRMSMTEGGEASGLGGLIKAMIPRFVSATSILFKRYLPLGILCLAACMVYYWQHQQGWDKKRDWQAYLPTIIYAVGGIASVYAMLATPSFSPRAWFGIVALLVIATGSAFALITPDKRVYTLLLCAAVLWVPKYAVDYKNALEDINNNTAYWHWAEEQIKAAKAQGEDEVVLPMHRPVTVYSHAGYYTEDPDAWPNTTLADWYDIGKISFSEDLDDPFYQEYDLT